MKHRGNGQHNASKRCLRKPKTGWGAGKALQDPPQARAPLSRRLLWVFNPDGEDPVGFVRSCFKRYAEKLGGGELPTLVLCNPRDFDALAPLAGEIKVVASNYVHPAHTCWGARGNRHETTRAEVI